MQSEYPPFVFDGDPAEKKPGDLALDVERDNF